VIGVDKVANVRSGGAAFCNISATPAGCALVDTLRRIQTMDNERGRGVQVVRAGFSILEAGGHIRAHCGATNTVLKMHLGVVVPSISAAADTDGDSSNIRTTSAIGARDANCAVMRVGRKTKAWAEGAVLFFDDSFEHEVWNRCATPRVIFQIVIQHPLLAGARA
jgi:aspartyl/asparaginyl beta-hydroxylase (cupin superfamily)